MNTVSTAEPIHVFISYRHANARLLQELSGSLGWLVNNSQIKIFDDRQILAGDDWDQMIKKELGEADIIILIVTASFMASSYCTQIELQHAIERRAKDGTRIVPIIAEYCDWKAMLIGAIAALPKDEKNNLKPLNKWGRNKDIALTQIAQQVRQNVERLVRERGVNNSSDLSSQQRNGTRSKIPLDISVVDSIQGDWLKSSTTNLKYTLRRTNDGIYIAPSMDYLSTLTDGGPIGPLHFIWVPFEWDFPILDFKIVNNSTETLFFSEIIFDVKESRRDPIPIIVIVANRRGNARHALITNEGWGLAKGMKLRFHLAPTNDRKTDPLYSEPYPFEITAGDLEKSLNIDFTEALRDAGVDFNGLEDFGKVVMRSGDDVTILNDKEKETKMTMDQFEGQRKSFLGPFPNGEALVSGVLEYQARDVDGEPKNFSVKFWTLVGLYNERLVGDPAPPSYEYTAKLCVEGVDYQVRAPISHVLKAGEADRFTVKLGMEKSSRHSFIVHLIFNGDEKITSIPIRMLTFVPRSGIDYLKEARK